VKNRKLRVKEVTRRGKEMGAKAGSSRRRKVPVTAYFQGKSACCAGHWEGGKGRARGLNGKNRE